MGRAVHVWCFGHFGLPVVVFPSAAGFAHEWDAHGMVDMLSPLILGGKIKLYCPESNVSRSWTSKSDNVVARMEEHSRYEAFVTQELAPLIQKDCGNNSLPLACTGCSLGGFYAVNFALKFPKLFTYALAMSGRYLATQFTGGVTNKDVYLNNPIAYVPGLQGAYLNRVAQHTQITLVCGQGAYEEGCIEETVKLGHILQNKGIPCTLDIWGLDSRHDWKWWKRQAYVQLNGRFGH